MKRVVLSIIGGIFLPFLYSILWIILFNLGERDSAFQVWVISARPVLIFPISWASHVYFYFFPPDPDFLMFTGFEFGNIISVITGNFLLYSILTYAVLSINTLRAKPKLA
jgi:hypothetical protein